MKSTHILATLIVATLAMCFSGQTIAQNKQSDASISGHIIDAKTGEHLPYVTVMVGGTQIGIQTSSSGHYVLRNLPLGKHDIIASFPEAGNYRKSGYPEGRGYSGAWIFRILKGP